MDIKNFLISTTFFVAFILLIGGIGYFSWRYFQRGLQKPDSQLNIPASIKDIQVNQNDDVEPKGKTGNVESSGIVQDSKAPEAVKTPTEPKPEIAQNKTQPNTNQQTTKPANPTNQDVLGIQTTYSTQTENATFSINKPKVTSDDDMIIFDYTFVMNSYGAQKLSEGMSYEIDENSCESYFDQDEEVFAGSYRKGEIGTGMGIKFQLPEGVLDEDLEDNNYLVSSTYSVYNKSGTEVFSGKTWAPKCD